MRNRCGAALLSIIIACFESEVAAAQAPDTAALACIRSEALDRSQVMDLAPWLTDVFGGRLTNSPALDGAADWATGRLSSWGMRTWRERWGPFGRGWTNDWVRVRVVSPVAFPVIANVEAWTPGTPGPVSGPAVLVTDLNSRDDFRRYHGRLTGAFVLLDSAPPITPPPFEPQASRHSAAELLTRSWPYPRPRTLDSLGLARRNDIIARQQAAIDFRSSEVPRFLAGEGAAAIVGASPGSAGVAFQAFRSEQQGTARRATPLPVLSFSAEQYGRIARILQKGLAVSIEADVRNTFSGLVTDSAYNIFAELKGSERPDELVIIGAHLDSFHYGTGATDNGVNVAVMMEAMRILQAARVPLRRTVRLALWTGEEQGMLGSLAYVHKHFLDSARPSPRLAAYFNLDNGAGAIRGPMVDQNSQLSSEADSTFRIWSQALRGFGIDIVSQRGGGGSDHVSFYVQGLPGFQFLQDWLDYETRAHHSNLDTFERIVPDDARRNAAIIASFAFLTANRDRPLPPMRRW